MSATNCNGCRLTPHARLPKQHFVVGFWAICHWRLVIRRRLVEPEVVATSPNRIKSPVPVYCGFSSEKWWAREDLHLQGSQTLDLRGLLFPLNHSPEEYSNGASHRCCPGTISLQKNSTGCCKEARERLNFG